MTNQEEAEEIKRILQDIDAIIVRTSQLSLGDARSRARCCLQDASSNLEGLYCRIQDGIEHVAVAPGQMLPGGLMPCNVAQAVGGYASTGSFGCGGGSNQSQFLPVRVRLDGQKDPTETPPPGVPYTLNCGWA